jgi:hypothetical protein
MTTLIAGAGMALLAAGAKKKPRNTAGPVKEWIRHTRGAPAAYPGRIKGARLSGKASESMETIITVVLITSPLWGWLVWWAVRTTRQ